MDKNKPSNMIIDVFNETYAYLKSRYDKNDLIILESILKLLLGFDNIKFIALEEKSYTYETIQETLALINEKETIRKSKGVYYTPIDVVQFIIRNSIKSVYGKLGSNDLQVIDLNDFPYKSFCLNKLILDPTCGSGEFLLTALEIKFDLLDNHINNITKGMVNKTVSTIYGNDINEDSTSISKIRLFLCALNRYGLKKCTDLATILNHNFSNNDFISTIPKSEHGFDLIIGNPPYVEDSKSELSLLKKYGNIYANVLINSAELLRDNGTLGFVIPLSYISTPRMSKIRDDLFKEIPEQYILSYADRPDCLFRAVHQKLCILIGRKRKSEKKIFTGNYQYWYREERPSLFYKMTVVKNNYAMKDYIPKLGTDADILIYKKVCYKKGRDNLANLADAGKYTVYVNMRATFWIKAFRKAHLSAEYKCFSFYNKGLADYFFCLVNSSLFWWYWVCISDCWHITNKELQSFMAPKIEDYAYVSELSDRLEKRLEETKVHVDTLQTEYEYKHKKCVDEIHEIDDYINKLFGLSDEENIYIKNFAYRYRVGGGAK